MDRGMKTPDGGVKVHSMPRAKAGRPEVQKYETRLSFFASLR
jgi:hypothetical protein